MSKIPREYVGYFLSADKPDEEPDYMPSRFHDCPVCGEPWSADDVRTRCLMWAHGAASVSVFYRLHRTCAESQSPEDAGRMDEEVLEHGDSIAREYGMVSGPTIQ